MVTIEEINPTYLFSLKKESKSASKCERSSELLSGLDG